LKGRSPFKAWTFPLSFEGEIYKRRVKERRSLSYIPIPLPLDKEKEIKGIGLLSIRG